MLLLIIKFLVKDYRQSLFVTMVYRSFVAYFQHLLGLPSCCHFHHFLISSLLKNMIYNWKFLVLIFIMFPMSFCVPLLNGDFIPFPSSISEGIVHGRYSVTLLDALHDLQDLLDFHFHLEYLEDCC